MVCSKPGEGLPGYRCVLIRYLAMNATVRELISAGVSSAQLARIAGVERSSASRWVAAEAAPREKTQHRLGQAVAAFRLWSGTKADFVTWLASINPSLDGKTPEAWIAGEGDMASLASAVTAACSVTHERAIAPNEIALSSVTQMLKAQEKFRSMFQVPSWLAAVQEVGEAASIAMGVLSTSSLLAATSTFAQTVKLHEQLSQSVQIPLSTYANVAASMSQLNASNAFNGMLESLASKNLMAVMGSAGDLLRGNQIDMGWGALTAAVEFRLSPAIAVATDHLAKSAIETLFAEQRAWHSWLPEHSESLLFPLRVESDWLAARSHTALQTGLATLGSEKSDQAELRVAVEAGELDFSTVIGMVVPGTTLTLRDFLVKKVPTAVEPLEAGLARLKRGEKDGARQAAASFRAVLDKVAEVIAPGPAKQRREAYQRSLGVTPGDPTARLIALQSELVYEIYQPVSATVHDSESIDAVRAYALAMVSCLLTILAKWQEKDLTPVIDLSRSPKTVKDTTMESDASPPALSEEQRGLLNIAFDAWMDRAEWPRFHWVESEAEKQGRANSGQLLTGMPGDLVRVDKHRGPLPNDPVVLTVPGLAQCKEPSTAYVNSFLVVIGWLLEKYEDALRSAGSNGTVDVCITSEMMRGEFDKRGYDVTDLIMARRWQLLETEPGIWEQFSRGVSLKIDHRIRRFRGALTIGTYLVKRNEVNVPGAAQVASLPDVIGTHVAGQTLNSLLVSPGQPWRNRRGLEQVVSECKTVLYWFDKNFSGAGLDIVGEVVRRDLISDIRILSLEDENQGKRVRRSYYNLAKELLKDGITLEWRFIDSKLVRDTHDRWIITGHCAWNIPNLNAVLSGQYSEIVKSDNVAGLRGMFEAMWQKAPSRPANVKSKDQT